MKASYVLLATVALITLTGMVATDVLLNQQYEKINWHDPYQNFEKRTLPMAKHWVIEGVPASEIVVSKTNGKSQVLLDSEYAKFYRSRQEKDTVYIAFTPNYSGYTNVPIEDAYRELSVRLVLQLPDVQTLRIKTARVTVSGLTTDQIQIQLENSRLRTHKLVIPGIVHLQERNNSFALLGNDSQLASLQLTVQDSSGVQLNDTPIENLSMQTSPKAKVFLQGQTLKWLKNK